MLKNKKPWIMVLLTTIGIAVVLSLLCIAGIHKMHSSKAKVFKELSTFVNTTVIPELKPMRADLEKAFSDEEKLQVKELRAEARLIAEMYTQLHEKYHSEEATTELVISEEDLADVKKSQKAMRKIITECWVILDNHEADFDALQKELLPKVEIWHKDLKNNMGKYMPHHKGHGKRAGLHKAHAQFGGGFIAPVVFILFEPETNFPFNMMQAGMEKYVEGGKYHKKCCSK